MNEGVKHFGRKKIIDILFLQIYLFKCPEKEGNSVKFIIKYPLKKKKREREVEKVIGQTSEDNKTKA